MRYALHSRYVHGLQVHRQKQLGSQKCWGEAIFFLSGVLTAQQRCTVISAGRQRLVVIRQGPSA